MTNQEIIASIACCGLVCKLCHLAGECDGCKETASKCSVKSEKDKGCYHRNCCLEKGINGCWECTDFPCDNQMFIGRTSREIKGFCRCIKEDGVETFIESILANQEKGIPYGLKGYGDKTEAEVVKLLRRNSDKL